MKIRNSMIALALMLVCVFAATAQEKSKADDSKAVPKLVVESFTHDFGEVKPGLPLSYSFKIKNVGKADLEIKAVQPSCGCTTSNYDKVVAPGKEGQITLALENTDGYGGEIAKSAAVKTNDPLNPNFNLILRAHFKVAVVPGQLPSPNAYIAVGKALGPFNVSPNDRWITSVITGSTAKTTLYLMNRETAPVRIKQVVVEGTEFTAVATPIEEGKRYEMTVATNPALKPGQYKQIVRVKTDSKTSPEMILQLEATVFPKVFATPTAINLPSTTTSSLESLNLPVIYVRKVRDGGLKIIRTSSTLPFFKVNVSTEAEGQIYAIRLTFDKSKIAAPGDFRGKVRIETNDADVPVLEIPIQGSFTQNSY